MKKWMMVVASLLLFTGCAADEEKAFSLTAAEQEAYTEAIDGVMEEFYWEYDRSSLTFGPAVVPENNEESGRLFSASSACEYNLKSKAGQDAVLAEASLLHYNGDNAGKLQCWFVGGQLAGVAYSGGYDNGYYSLKERNPFVADGGFRVYESWHGHCFQRGQRGIFPRRHLFHREGCQWQWAGCFHSGWESGSLSLCQWAQPLP